jgi:chemotaxis response regulator CheB
MCTTKKSTSLSPAKNREGELAVVGIGASAGGLKALRSFFGALPDCQSEEVLATRTRVIAQL